MLSTGTICLPTGYFLFFEVSSPCLSSFSSPSPSWIDASLTKQRTFTSPPSLTCHATYVTVGKQFFSAFSPRNDHNDCLQYAWATSNHRTALFFMNWQELRGLIINGTKNLFKLGGRPLHFLMYQGYASRVRTKLRKCPSRLAMPENAELIERSSGRGRGRRISDYRPRGHQVFPTDTKMQSGE